MQPFCPCYFTSGRIECIMLMCYSLIPPSTSSILHMASYLTGNFSGAKSVCQIMMTLSDCIYYCHSFLVFLLLWACRLDSKYFLCFLFFFSFVYFGNRNHPKSAHLWINMIPFSVPVSYNPNPNPLARAICSVQLGEKCPIWEASRKSKMDTISFGNQKLPGGIFGLEQSVLT